MYQFRITEQENGGFRFEFGGIKMLVDDYTIQDDRHILKNPSKAVAYFDIENNLYGVSNEPSHYRTAEDFFDAMSKQMKVLSQVA